MTDQTQGQDPAETPTTEPTYAVLIYPKDIYDAGYTDELKGEAPAPTSQLELADWLKELKAGPLFFGAITRSQYQGLTGDYDCQELNNRLAYPAVSTDNYDCYLTAADVAEGESSAYAVLCDHWRTPHGADEPIPQEQRHQSAATMTPKLILSLMQLHSEYMHFLADSDEIAAADDYELAEFYGTAREYGIDRRQLLRE